MLLVVLLAGLDPLGLPLLRSRLVGAALLRGKGVQLGHHSLALQRVHLHLELLRSLELGLQTRLYLGAVDDAVQVSILHLSTRQVVVLLQGRAALRGAIDIGQLLESPLSPDDEAAEVATRCKLQEVQARHTGRLHARNVAHGADNAVVLKVHDQGSLAHGVAAIAHLAPARTDLLGVHDLLQLLLATELLQDIDRLLGLRHGLDAIRNHKGQLRNLADAVSTSHHQRRQGARCERRRDGVPLLRHIHAPVPAAPRPRGAEHVTAAGHVAVSALARPVGAASRNTWDTRDGTTRAPRCGACLVAGLSLDGHRLALVLGHVRVDVAHQVRAKRRGQHLRHGHGVLLLGRGIELVHGHHRPGGRHVSERGWRAAKVPAGTTTMIP
mmetsp:Transcript_41827/g.106441  ORF Transcript_41827/g.106441 Transcript_41827/m.106441 type:complete len:383 (-) Transcript_41827:9-1157(-)